jgi:DNA polymerase kappa
MHTDEVAVDTVLTNVVTQDVASLSPDVDDDTPPPQASQHHSLKHQLLGPSLTKAGQDAVDQKKVSEVIYEASRGSKFFNNEEVRDKTLTTKIDRILKRKEQLEKLDLKADLRRADDYITSLELSRDLSQSIVHIDCDAFYAAVEEIDHPELKDVPFAVGQGVLTTCNYHARKFGCRSAMAGFVAKKLCPQLVCLPLNFDKYTAKAKEVRAILAAYDPRFESSSIDEAYLNITEYCLVSDIGPEAAVAQLRAEVQKKCKITISAGIASNAKIAKICSNKNKPNGQFCVASDRSSIMAFMSTLPVRRVNGVGRVFERELDAIGVRTCGDIYSQRAYLSKLFGEKAFQFLIQTYLGLGRTDVRPSDEYERKSVGTESTFRDMSTKTDLRERLRHTAEELEKDLLRVGFKGRTLVLKIKLHTYEVFTRQVAPPKAVHTTDDLYNYSLPMLTKLEKEIPNMKLRLMGLRCTHLVSTKKEVSSKFFGPAAKPPSPTNDALDDDGWEVFPEFPQPAPQECQEESTEQERPSNESQGQPPIPDTTADFHSPFGRYKTNHLRNTAAHEPVEEGYQASEESTWSCPICLLRQPADDNAFNSHIDYCLSKQTIRDTVAGDTGRDVQSRSRSDSSYRGGGDGGGGEAGVNQQRGGKRKAAAAQPVGSKGRRVVVGDGRQRRLIFD